MLLLLLLVLLLLRGTEIEGWGREEARPNERLHGHRCVRKKTYKPCNHPPPSPPPPSTSSSSPVQLVAARERPLLAP